MRIAIDAQSLQVSALGEADLDALPDYRLLQSLVSSAAGCEIVVAFNEAHGESADRIRNGLLQLNPGLRSISPALPWPVDRIAACDSARASCLRELWAASIAAIRPDAILVLSPALDDDRHDRIALRLGAEMCPVVCSSEHAAFRARMLREKRGEFGFDDQNRSRLAAECAQLWLLWGLESPEIRGAGKEELSHAPDRPPAQIAMGDDDRWVAPLWRELDRIAAARRRQPRAAAKPKRGAALAFFSPMPPESTGIADYSAAMLPELAKHYQITVVTPQFEVGAEWTRTVNNVRDPRWFRENFQQFDRVLYQMGNSHYHAPMLETMALVPGVVALHDIGLSSLHQWRERAPGGRGSLAKELYHCHGWVAVADQHSGLSHAELLNRYHCNLRVLQNAIGTIVHSRHAYSLLEKSYGEEVARWCRVVPLVRPDPGPIERGLARSRIGIGEGIFLVCSFGRVGGNKLSRRILDAWMRSSLSGDPSCMLAFVGEQGGGEDGFVFAAGISAAQRAGSVRCTGRVSVEDYRLWLCAADLAVQLRSGEGGETSGPALDCLNFGVPVISNAHGAMREMPKEAALLLPGEFTDEQLANALSLLRQSNDQRAAMAKAGREEIESRHRPATCAHMVASAIEAAYATPARADAGLVERSAADAERLSREDRRRFAIAAAQAIPPWPRKREILFDVTGLLRSSLRTGIERVTQELFFHCVKAPPEGYRVEAICAMPADEGYRYARRFVTDGLGLDSAPFFDEPVEPASGDILLITHMHHGAIERQRALLEQWSRSGVRRFAMVYDLLPLQMPERFVPGHAELHRAWLELVRTGYGAVCISRTVAEELRTYLRDARGLGAHARIFSIPMGADIGDANAGGTGKPIARKARRELGARPSCLMVGTIEPRKGHLQAIRAFTDLWAGGADLNLILVGREGWLGAQPRHREPVVQIVTAIRKHPEFAKRLLWLSDLNDNSLRQIYHESGCLLAASEGEGFGLPILEAMQAGLPIVARDIPVFREVTRGQAHFFADSRDPGVIRDAILHWFGRRAAVGLVRSPFAAESTWAGAASALSGILAHS